MTAESTATQRPPTTAAPTLAGAFVTLRALTVDDAAITHGWRESARARHLNRSGAGVADQARWIASRPDDELNYVIERVDGLAIGMLSLIAIDRANARAESARFLIGDEAAAKGTPAAVEAMKLLYTLAFDQLGLQRVYGFIGEPNGLMIKWQKHLGMREEGRLRRHYRIDGVFVDAVVLGLLEEDYRTVTLPRMQALIAMGRTPPRRT